MLKKRAIELLAFISMIKAAHNNSILYKDAAYKMAQKLGISDGRIFTKYLTICLDMGICTEGVQPYNTNCFRTVYKFIAYRDALNMLLGIKKSQMRFFPLRKGVCSFKKYQYKIEQDIAALNFSQQAYKAASNFPNKQKIMKEISNLSKLPVSEKQTRSARSKQRKLVKKLASADATIQESRRRGNLDAVVTGCNHIGKLIGKSGTTGAKRIKKWMEEKSLQVHDMVYFQPTSSELEAAILVDELIQNRVKGIHLYSKKEKGVKTVVGKKVLGFTSGGFSHGTPVL